MQKKERHRCQGQTHGKKAGRKTGRRGERCVVVRLRYKGGVEEVAVEEPRELDCWLERFSEEQGLSAMLGISLKISVVKEVMTRECWFAGEHRRGLQLLLSQYLRVYRATRGPI